MNDGERHRKQRILQHRNLVRAQAKITASLDVSGAPLKRPLKLKGQMCEISQVKANTKHTGRHI